MAGAWLPARRAGRVSVVDVLRYEQIESAVIRDVVIADDPTGLLERSTGLQVMALLRGYCEQGSLIAVTHDPEVLGGADRVVTLRSSRIAHTEGRLAHTVQRVPLREVL